MTDTAAGTAAGPGPMFPFPGAEVVSAIYKNKVRQHTCKRRTRVSKTILTAIKEQYAILQVTNMTTDSIYIKESLVTITVSIVEIVVWIMVPLSPVPQSPPPPTS